MKRFMKQTKVIKVFYIFLFFPIALLYSQKEKKEYDDFEIQHTLFSGHAIHISSSNIVELFEGNFPPGGWQLINPNAGSLTFTQFAGANGPSISGNQCVLMPFYSYGTQNHRDTLKTPVLLNPQSTDSLIFEWAYQFYQNPSYYDSFFVLISTDGGLTYPISVFRRGGPTLATAGGSTNSFVPTSPSQWQRFAYPLAGLTNVSVAFVAFNRYGNNLYIDNVILGKQKNYDLFISKIANIAPDTNYIIGSSMLEISPTVLISNLGMQHVDTVTIVKLHIPEIGYQQQLILNSIQSGSTVALTFPVLTVPSGFPINITVFTENALDENASNDTLRQASILFQATNRSHILYEQWTSTTCAPCASNNPTIDAFLMQYHDSTVAIKYHVGWPSPGNDPMYLHNPTQSYERRYYYGVNSVPQIWVDGLITPVYPYTTPGSLLAPFRNRQLVPTPIASLNVTSTRPAVDTIHSVVTVNILSPLMSQTYLRVQAIESIINYATPPGTNGETTFHDVFRRAYPTTLGILLPTNAGSYVYEFTYKIDPVWVDTNIYTIAFIQNDKTKEVYAAGKSGRARFILDVSDNPNLPYYFSLEPNYPNPFNPSTTIRFSIPESGRVRLSVYNILGQKVVDLVDQIKPAGVYQVQWNGKDFQGNAVASGIYFYRLEAGSFVKTRKMTLIR